MKIVLTVVLVLLLLALGYWFFFVREPGGICIQVITSAKNPITGEIRDFPTPCSVPLGWKKLEGESLKVF